MRLDLALEPSVISFTRVADGGEFPWMLTVGTLRLQARAGHLTGIGVGETPSLQVVLDNKGKKAAKVIGRPLRVRATVYDGDDLFFDGTVASIEYGRVAITLTLES